MINTVLCLAAAAILALIFSGLSDYALSVVSPSPTVSFPNEAQVIKYLKQQGNYNANVTNLSKANSLDNGYGEASNIQVADGGNFTYAVWQARDKEGINHVFLALLEKQNQPAPSIELTNHSTGNATNLQIAASGQAVYVAWQATNSTSHLHNIFVSSTMNSTSFKTYQVTQSNVDATNPMVTGAGHLFWLQDCIPPNHITKCPFHHWHW